MGKNKQENNFAFIDSQNLNLGIKELGWELDFRKFRIYLKEKYSVKNAYLFIGYLPANQNLYTSLQKYGYLLVFKPVIKNEDGGPKGKRKNCLYEQSKKKIGIYKTKMKKHRLGTEPKKVPFRNDSIYILAKHNNLSSPWSVDKYCAIFI